MRLYLIGELEDLPLHVVVETTAELADAFGRVEGYRFVTRAELELLTGGAEAISSWYEGDDRTFREHTRFLQRALDAEETEFDRMTQAAREGLLRPRLLDAGHPPTEVERLIRQGRRRGIRIVQDDTGHEDRDQSR